jgi:hypothetical protein
MYSNFSIGYTRSGMNILSLFLGYFLFILPFFGLSVSYAQTPTEAYEYVANPLIQSNDSSLI